MHASPSGMDVHLIYIVISGRCGEGVGYAADGCLGVVMLAMGWEGSARDGR